MAQETVNIILVDRQRLLKASLFSDVKSKVETDLNRLFRNELKLSFNMLYRAVDATTNERASFRKFDFVIYIFNQKDPPRTDVREINQIMQDHQIRDKGEAGKFYRIAQEEWRRDAGEGIGIPPLTGYRKVGFIKMDFIFRRTTCEPKDFLTNVVKHEFGHMCNAAIISHTKQLMALSVPCLWVDYLPEDRARIFATLRYLQSFNEQQLDKQYIKSNP